MKNIFSIALMSLGIALFFPSIASAHPGSTDAKGGHYCLTNCEAWGLYDNEYHYHNSNGTSVFTYDNNKGYYDESLSERLKGRILLQVEDHGEAWYIRKEDGMRYYMADGNAAYEMMRYFSLGISNADLDKIPKVNDSLAMNKSTSICKSNALANRLKGEILLQVDNHGEAYYVDPVKCRAIYMADGAAAYQIMRYLGLGAKNEDINKIVLGMSDTILEYIFAPDEPAMEPVPEPTNPVLPAVDSSRDHVWGMDNARVTMIEYSDFECPFCARHNDTMDAIKATYPNDVRIVYRHFPLSFHTYAQKAAEASECAADQGKFWEMHDKIFELSKSGYISIDSLKQAATDLSLDRGQFDPCLDSGIKASRVTEDLNQGMVAGVQGTPATFINGELVSGAMPLENFTEIIDNLIAIRNDLAFPGVLPDEQIKNKQIRIKTTKGDIVFEVLPEDAPKAASNFIYLTEQSFYNGLTFHRVEPGFVIQGGDPYGNGTGGPGYTFEDEAVNLPYNEGIVAMANAGPNTNGSQFFIMLADHSLPPNYSIFGRVIAGMDVVKQISANDIMTSVTIESLK